MALGVIDDARCFLCGDKIINGYELHELAEDQWEVVCLLCVLVTELGEGK